MTTAASDDAINKTKTSSSTGDTDEASVSEKYCLLDLMEYRRGGVPSPSWCDLGDGGMRVSRDRRR